MPEPTVPTSWLTDIPSWLVAIIAFLGGSFSSMRFVWNTATRVATLVQQVSALRADLSAMKQEMQDRFAETCTSQRAMNQAIGTLTEHVAELRGQISRCPTIRKGPDC